MSSLVCCLEPIVDVAVMLSCSLVVDTARLELLERLERTMAAAVGIVGTRLLGLVVMVSAISCRCIGNSIVVVETCMNRSKSTILVGWLLVVLLELLLLMLFDRSYCCTFVLDRIDYMLVELHMFKQLRIC